MIFVDSLDPGSMAMVRSKDADSQVQFESDAGGTARLVMMMVAESPFRTTYAESRGSRRRIGFFVARVLNSILSDKRQFRCRRAFIVQGGQEKSGLAMGC